MTEAETRYPQMEKLALALVTSARKLRPYFQAHTILVLTNLPLKNIFLKPETSGRLVKWALELSEYDIQFGPRTVLKEQAVADFIVELTPPSQSTESDLSWTIYVDGSSNERGCGAGILLLAQGGERFEYALRFNFRTSNNEAEYEALLAGLRVAKRLGANHVKVFSDSQLIVNQIKEEYQTNDPRMEKYLTKLASAYETDLARSVPVEILDSPSILEPDVMEVDTPSPSWVDPIVEFIKGNPPQDPKEQKKMARRAARFTLREGALYRRGFSLPLLKCVTPEEGLYILREIYEGACGNDSGARSLSAKVVRQGYYWPTIEQDARQFVKTCDNCQRFANIIHQPLELLTPISAPWPFAQWGVDIIGPFPLGKGQTKFAVVAMDYFTKWAEAEALSHITESRVTSFIWANVVCRFGIPNAIVTDNGKQFDNAKFKDFCSNLGIRHLSSSPAHPKANGQVEAVNKIIKRELKLRLDSRMGRWAEELPEVLWSYQTTPRESTGETPFSLAFGSEAIVPVEIGIPTNRVEQKFKLLLSIIFWTSEFEEKY
ncbi:protein NYNRIN-like [Momordica charantia]|uniref:Protein NYNRIN-like n=1 Tax=Momordica charantia TaxID=3673 RepID=A0A6J1D7W6_MOMCH|nr:protein NYNRIN-like [Momordica charantia]